MRAPRAYPIAAQRSEEGDGGRRLFSGRGGPRNPLKRLNPDKEIQGFSFDCLWRAWPGLAGFGQDLDSAWIGLGLISPLLNAYNQGGGAAHCAPRRERLYPADPRAVSLARGLRRWALSSAVEHYLDIVGVRGSIPLAPTISCFPASFSRRFSATGVYGAVSLIAAPNPSTDLHPCHCGRRLSPTLNDRRAAGRSCAFLPAWPSSSPPPTLRRPRPNRRRSQGQARRLGDALRDAARRRP